MILTPTLQSKKNMGWESNAQDENRDRKQISRKLQQQEQELLISTCTNSIKQNPRK